MESVGHRPNGKWEFDSSVASCFDDMLQRSIPDYIGMRDLVFRIGSRFVKDNTAIVDLGCSRGDALVPFIRDFGCYNKHVGVECSDAMLEVCRERFSGLIDSGVVSIQDLDLRHEFPRVSASLILSVLTLQFIPIEYRQHVLRNCYESLVSGGALILVEKVLGSNALIDELLVDEYLKMKRRNGYSEEDVLRKKLSLEGVLVPLPMEENMKMLGMEGFRSVDVFWRNMNFCGIFAVKD